MSQVSIASPVSYSSASPSDLASARSAAAPVLDQVFVGYLPHYPRRRAHHDLARPEPRSGVDHGAAAEGRALLEDEAGELAAGGARPRPQARALTQHDAVLDQALRTERRPRVHDARRAD